MSFVIRRQLSTLIPPKIASARSLGSNPHAKRMADVVSFYQKLPKGAAPAPKPTANPFTKYYRAYFEGDNASGKPLLHLIALVVVVGYTWEYQSHLKHHH
ncbi:ATP synthase f chain mitochondrial precursor [Spathaspora passalidarum NRRL Y-27907]|uniref:ATP synthase f chain mitochondrial n=1 Tax=Spathaspora passalidarum (strain NRRL Y-27907 / 11-Y1) TaxID=619300 RepID=G3AJD0_SPAPN|nr:ATP synthase f chain mitochondrial precursor [Spathaspora passalidarum NRRL Y-27907]EGW34589.1 ATP synthase f chain mitochondrial precursor [Spathaspora passalidarum NRRL Y-27907]